ncbi:MAG TPA: endolytic transglycosylase MltG [Rhizomicrobium sp.]
MTRFIAFLIALAIILAGVMEWESSNWKARGPGARDSVILIAPHTHLRAIAAALEKDGAIKNALTFQIGVRYRGETGDLKAGEYAIAARASMADIAAILIAGKSIEHKLTAAEGLTSQMIYAIVAADPVLKGNAGPVPAEGTLLPETYLFTRGMTRAQMLAKMAKAQSDLIAALWPGRDRSIPFLTPQEAIILASIVEKETALPEERRHVASVFINRLRIGMKIQSDPTIIYGLTKGYPLGRGIRQSELTGATPYNTYVIVGLPPTPICNPGKDSIAAVLNPEKTSDLYFVANGTGGHVFAATVAAQNKNVAAWRAIERRQKK